MIAKVEWQHDQIYTATSDSGHTVTIDGAHATGASPMEYVLMALCGCTSVDVVSILTKKREPFTGLTVSATAQKATEFPSVFTSIQLVYRVNGSVNAKSMEDAIRLSKEKYCSVSAMLGKTATITYTIEYADA
jgi:putative redox protein